MTKLYELFRGNLHWHYSLMSRPVLTLFSAPFRAFENPVNRTYKLDSPPNMQGLFAYA